MLISGFHVDHFGKLKELSLEGLPAGLCVFLGQNEAGKSTCLDFFRAMLTGFPDGRAKKENVRNYVTGAGNNGGGSLTLETPQGTILLTRRPGVGGGIVTLADPSGTALDPALLDRLMGGITREVFKNVYGFSLNELQELASLNAKEVRDALYGASFGLGLRSPGQALKRIEAGMEELFKAKAVKLPMNEGFHHFEELRAQIRSSEQEAVRFDEISAELHRAETDLAQLRRERSAQQQEALALERRHGVWRQWDEWRLAGAKLERLAPIADTFPADGLARLNRAEDRRYETARQCRVARERMEKTVAELEGFVCDEALLEKGEMLYSLAERKESCRTAVTEIGRISLELRQAEAELGIQLATLGPDWDVERIRNVDRSLFVRGEIEQQSSAMQAAETACANAKTAVEKAGHEATEARHALELAGRTYETLPAPKIQLDETVREKLRKSLAKTEDAQQRLPERIKAQDAARAEFERMSAQLGLKPGEAPLSVLDRLSAAQDEALRRANEVAVAFQEAALAKNLLEQAREAEKQARQRMFRLQDERSEKEGGPTRQSLESRRDGLRRLRKLAGELVLEQNRASEVRAGLEAYLASIPDESAHKAKIFGGAAACLLGLALCAMYAFAGGEDGFAGSGAGMWGALLLAVGYAVSMAGQKLEHRYKTALAAGVLLAGGGISAIIARRLMHIQHVALPSGELLQLELWAGYLALLAGVGLAWWGMPRGRTGRTTQEMVLEQWRQRCESAEKKVTGLETDTARLAAVLGMDDCSIEAMDALEAEIDQERESWAKNERMDQEMSSHAKEVEALQRRAVELEADHAMRNGRLQTAKRQWHAYLVGLGVQGVPDSEQAQTFFMRVESARQKWAAVQAFDLELNEMEACGLELMRLSRDLLPQDMQAAGKTSLAETNLADVIESVQSVLASCREADQAAEKRARAAEAMRAAEERAERAKTMGEEAQKTLAETEKNLRFVNEAWRELLRRLGLTMQLSPGTTREALECMGRCLDMEAEVRRLRDELERRARERDAFILPLREMMEELGRAITPGLDGEIDWMGGFDALMRELEEARKKDERRRQCATLRDEQEQDLREAEQADADAVKQLEDLLALAGVPDAEEFRLKEAVRAERETLERRRQDLEDMLRLAADEMPLDAFLEEFALLDKASLEARMTELAAELERTTQKEEQLADAVGTLRARLEGLATSGLLADLRGQEACLGESLRLLGMEWSRFALARHLLIEARRKFEKERQPEVIRAASELFAMITDNEWIGITASLEDADLKVQPAHGEPLQPTQLSRGTQEQLYLALRIAHIQHHATLSEPLPVIMDDVLVNFDPERSRRTAEAYLSLIRGGHQLLYFTCHPQTAEMLCGLDADSALYHVDKGKIKAA